MICILLCDQWYYLYSNSETSIMIYFAFQHYSAVVEWNVRSLPWFIVYCCPDQSLGTFHAYYDNFSYFEFVCQFFRLRLTSPRYLWYSPRPGDSSNAVYSFCTNRRFTGLPHYHILCICCEHVPRGGTSIGDTFYNSISDWYCAV